MRLSCLKPAIHQAKSEKPLPTETDERLLERTSPIRELGFTELTPLLIHPR